MFKVVWLFRFAFIAVVVVLLAWWKWK